jgi:hypothetical protein
MKVKVSGVDILESDCPEVWEELRKHSITPTSFESRSYKSTKDDPTFVEKYSHIDAITRVVTNSIIRFGINPLVIDQTKVDELNLEFSSSSPPSASASGRSGGSSKSAFPTDIVARIKHHPTEIEVLQDAIDHLFSTGERTAICDILRRDKGEIKKGEVHAVVLYKNPADISGKHDIIVIDPSNFSYSSHLSNSYLTQPIAGAAGSQPKITNDQLGTIITFHCGTQIYKPEEKTGPGANEFRDCIDIAVKLAFEFNNLPADFLFKSVSDIRACSSVRAISNLTDIDKAYVGKELTEIDKASNLKKYYPLRVKQSSDAQVVRKFNLIANAIEKIFEEFKIADSSYDIESKESGYKVLLKRPYGGTYVSDLLEYSIALQTELIGILNADLHSLEAER